MSTHNIFILYHIFCSWSFETASNTNLPDYEGTIDNEYGIAKLTDSPIDRIQDYKSCLLEARGDCFISGTSMIHLTEDSNDVLKEKLWTGRVYLLMLDPDWIEENSSILTFIKEEYRREFHHEIRNSIRKLDQLRQTLPKKLTSCLKIKTYSTIFPYIITGFDAGEIGKLVFEITDYIPEKVDLVSLYIKPAIRVPYMNRLRANFFRYGTTNPLSRRFELMNKDLYFKYEWKYKKRRPEILSAMRASFIIGRSAHTQPTPASLSSLSFYFLFGSEAGSDSGGIQ